MNNTNDKAMKFIEELYKENYSKMLNMVRKDTLCAAMAEDIVQDAFTEAVRNAEKKTCKEGEREYYAEASHRLLSVARLIMYPALLRKESRGGHYREDYPNTDESYEVHSVQRYGEDVATAPVNGNYFKF